MEISDLFKSIGWITFRYPDGSKKYFRTTLDPEILDKIPGERVGNAMYDLDKFKWHVLPSNPEVELQVTKDLPEVSEVDKFVHRFI